MGSRGQTSNQERWVCEGLGVGQRLDRRMALGLPHLCLKRVGRPWALQIESRWQATTLVEDLVNRLPGWQRAWSAGPCFGAPPPMSMPCGLSRWTAGGVESLAGSSRPGFGRTCTGTGRRRAHLRRGGGGRGQGVWRVGCGGASAPSDLHAWSTCGVRHLDLVFLVCGLMRPRRTSRGKEHTRGAHVHDIGFSATCTVQWPKLTLP